MIGRGREANSELDFELNITSIIDCFVVLIMYLLTSATFIALGVFDVTTPSPSISQRSGETQPIDVSIEMNERKNLQVRLSGAEDKIISLPAKADNWDLVALSSLLADLRGRWPGLNSLLLSASNSTEYKEVIQVMEALRSGAFNVSLGDRGNP